MHALKKSEVNMEKFDFCVFIGRFSPLQKAHKFILDKALTIAEKVIVVVGSCGSPRTIRNPWSGDERQEMIRRCLSSEEKDRVIFISMKDYTYNDNLWISTLQQKVSEATDYSEKVSLIGYESDESSYYLKLFPQYKYIQCGTEYNFHATQVRDLYFSHNASYKTMVPNGVAEYLENFKQTKEFVNIKQEKYFIDNYKEQWRGAPFPPIFVTVDTIVVKSGHVLIVTRRSNPGKGLLALPGGFVNQKEKLQDAALRELKEETGIKINTPDLKKSIADFKVFDDPLRSARGRTITNAYLIDLGIGPLPQVKGADDAERAFWLPLGEFHSMENEFFEDHYHIIKYFVSKF
jgi:bifunctional NMN adenylyltransferase/nudix hydrolase